MSDRYGKLITTTSSIEDFYRGFFDACGHTIRFKYDLIKGERLTDEEMGQLDEAAEDRAREMIAEDYVEGELCTNIPNPEGIDAEDREYRGWWNIRRDNESN